MGHFKGPSALFLFSQKDDCRFRIKCNHFNDISLKSPHSYLQPLLLIPLFELHSLHDKEQDDNAEQASCTSCTR